MLTWLKNHLFNRWSFNLLIWYGIRLLLRIVVLVIAYYLKLPFGDVCSGGCSPVYLFLDPLVQIFTIFPPIIVFFLERKFGFRFSPKFFQNNIAFVLYILLTIAALIIAIPVLFFTILLFIMSLPDHIIMLFNSYDLQEYLKFNLHPYNLIFLLLWML